MKTNQIMLRENGFIQRTSDGYFSATELIKHWNSCNENKKQLAQYQLLQSTTEFIEHLKSEGIERPVITARGKGEYSGTWVHPKVFIDLAMWVSVKFKSKVIDFVIDGLIQSRQDAGDYYKEMTSAILDNYLITHGTRPPAVIYIKEANFLKTLVGAKDRNNMTESELRQLTYLQKFNTMLLNKKIGYDSRIKQLQMASEVTI